MCVCIYIYIYTHNSEFISLRALGLRVDRPSSVSFQRMESHRNGDMFFFAVLLSCPLKNLQRPNFWEMPYGPSTRTLKIKNSDLARPAAGPTGRGGPRITIACHIIQNC